jgi:eukaryotic-like serine/threonine-protein kinase
VLSALSYAHARGIVHRDIKPANMMLTKTGTVKLMDFGIARAAGENKLTQTGSTLGSIYYMSPEQVQGQTLDSRSDLYSLGVTLYELVTGLHPFEGDTGFTIMKGHIDGTFTPPRQVNPNLSPALNEVILHAMARDADERYQNADDFSAALQNVKQLIATSPAAAVGMPAGATMAATTPSRPAFTPPTGVRPPASAPATPPLPAVPPAPVYAPTMASHSQPQVTPPAYVPPAAAAAPAQPYTPAAQAPAAQTSGAILPPPQQVPSSKRALYIGLGSALTILLIVLTAMKLPAFNKSGTDTQPAPAVVTPAPQPNPAPTPAPTTSATPVPDSAPPSAAPAADPAAAAAAAKKAREAAAAKKAQDDANAAAAAEAARAAEEAAKLYDEQENRFVHMSSRAAAMKTSFETLRNQQAAAGYSPSGEFTKAVSSMDQFLGRAEAALSNHDGATAKKYMDMAEPQIEILERKFGR